VLSLKAKREVQEARNVLGAICEPALRKQREEELHPKKPKSASHIFRTFRDGHKVLRERNGRFAKETAPRHKRPKRIPWDKKDPVTKK
jgi:hypothetical protein